MSQRSFLTIGMLLFVALIAQRTRRSVVSPHAHETTERAGTILSLDDDAYHVEACLTDSNQLTLYLLGRDPSQVLEIDAQTLYAHVRSAGATRSQMVPLKSDPQPGDAQGRTSRLSGMLPVDQNEIRSMLVTVPNVKIAGRRFHLTFSIERAESAEMPPSVSEAEARQLYFEPGGKYTREDIAANGSLIPAEKYRAFRATHDFEPSPGDRLCPISRTVANPACRWIVAGREYLFCCPPCIDEFVRMAKEQPDAILEPGQYVR